MSPERLQLNKAPLITVVTPSYNQGQFIEETIKSVISQEGDFYLEYLIMDGGSTDETVSVIKKYDSLIKEGKWPLKCKGISCSWVSEKDKGQTDAVNKGFRRAKGEFLGWLNSDDTYLPGALQKAINFLSARPDTIMVYGEGYMIDRDGRIIERYFTEPFDLKRLSEICYICQPTVFLRRSVLTEVGFLDDSLNYCMDYDYWMKIAGKARIGYLKEFLANTRIYAETKTMSKRKEAHAEILSTVKKYYGVVPNAWVYAYTRVALERWFIMDNGLKRTFFKMLWPVLYFFKFLQVNRTMPSMPFTDIKDFLKK